MGLPALGAGNQAGLCSDIGVSNTPRNRAEVQTLLRPINHLPESFEEFQSTYHSFKDAKNERYFTERLRNAFKDAGISLKKEKAKLLFDISQEKNEEFVARYEKQKVENLLVMGYESSHLRDLNFNKEGATSLNHFAKMNLLTSIFEEAAKTNPKTLEMLRKRLMVKMEIKEDVSGVNNQNDYKTLRLAISYESKKELDTIMQILDRAYRRTQSDLLFLLESQYPEYYTELTKKLPPHISMHRLFRGLMADSIRDLKLGEKEVKYIKDDRLLHFSRGSLPVRKRVERNIRNFFKYWDYVDGLLSTSNKLILIEDGVPYPAPEFYKVMKVIAPVPGQRNSNNKRTQADNHAYYKSVQKELGVEFKVNLSLDSVQALVKYYHAAKRVVPSFIATRLEPLNQQVTSDLTTIISADKRNASGIELAMVAKELLKEKQLNKTAKTEDFFNASTRGVDEATEILREWGNNFSAFMWKALSHIALEAKTSGDDANYRFVEREPLTREELYEFVQYASKPEIREIIRESRITMAPYNKGEMVQEKVGKLEDVEKAIEVAYRNEFRGYKEQYPDFMVVRDMKDHGKAYLLFLEKVTEEQVYIIESLIETTKSSYEFDVSIMKDLLLKPETQAPKEKKTSSLKDITTKILNQFTKSPDKD